MSGGDPLDDVATREVPNRLVQRPTMTCARCERDTGNNNQGHYWAYCKVTKTRREFHFCCPGDCALEAAETTDTNGDDTT